MENFSHTHETPIPNLRHFSGFLVGKRDHIFEQW